jgi:diguanylate cyclase (GGDEF)-like protein/PAS domain S-box-containing protein
LQVDNTTDDPHTQAHSIGVDVLKMLCVAALYAGLSWLVLKYLSNNGAITPVYLPSGVALAALLIGGRRYAVAIFLGAFFGSMLPGHTLVLPAALAASSTLGAVLGFWLLTRNKRFDPSLAKLSDYLRLIVLGAFVPAVASALTGVSCLLLANVVTTELFVAGLLDWWMGDVLGVVLMTPFVLTWRSASKTPIDRNKFVEAMLIIGLTALAGQIIFLAWFHDNALIKHVSHASWMFLFAVWVALRLGLRGTTASLLIIAAQGIVSTYGRIGYFTNDLDNEKADQLWLFLVTYAVTSVSLATFLAARKRADAELVATKNLLQEVLNGLPFPVFVKDGKSRFILMNKASEKQWGIRGAEVYGTDASQFFPPVQMDGFLAADRQAFEQGKAFDLEEEVWSQPQQQNRVSQTFKNPVFDAAGNPLYLICATLDITERRKMEEQVRQLAFYDALTHLPNRRLFIDRLSQTLAASKRSACYGALMFLDLDNFKPINDAYGHGVGDLLLIEAADRLRSCVREIDTVARFGGDEFVVMLSDLNTDKAASIAQARTVAEKILAKLSEPYVLTVRHPGQADTTVEHQCTVSIGVAMFINHEVAGQDDVLKWADRAMYQAKESGRNTIQFYTSNT